MEIIKLIEKKCKVGDLRANDEFEFMGSEKSWRVISNDPSIRRVRVRHLNGKGKDSWMNPDREVFKIKYDLPSKIEYCYENLHLPRR